MLTKHAYEMLGEVMSRRRNSATNRLLARTYRGEHKEIIRKVDDDLKKHVAEIDNEKSEPPDDDGDSD